MRLLTSLFLLAALPFAASAGEPSVSRRVAMIFDDGPVLEQTEKFLALLKEENVRVTFAYVGQNAAKHPALARAAADAGHEIVNHSHTHPHLQQLDDEAVRREVAEARDAIATATGRTPQWFWAPFLEIDERISAIARSEKLEPFPFQRVNLVSTEDWNSTTDAATIRRRATTGIEDRTIILCHEWREETFTELPAILAELKRQGCTFITFTELAELLP
jgi:peptidoglycan/xylan/chitin deacetylase (PgdA/CDA1 family)